MGNMKTKKHVTYGFFIVILGLFTLTACGGKSIQDDLKSHDWTLERQNSQERPTAHFTDTKMTLSEFGVNITTDYEISKDKISFTVKNDDKTDTQKFEIKKEKDTYKLSPNNESAKKDSGEMTLIPK